MIRTHLRQMLPCLAIVHLIQDALAGSELSQIQKFDSNTNINETFESILTLRADLPSLASAGDGKEKRALAIGDFDSLNELFDGAQLKLLNETTLGVDGMELSIRNVYCTQINLGDINTNYTVFVNSTTNQETVAYTLNVNPFRMQCYAEYSYNVAFLLQGSGTFEAVTDNNEVAARIDLISPSTFTVAAPSRAEIQWCQTVVRTDGNVLFKADGRGDITDDILNLFKGPVSDLIDVTASQIVCGEIGKLGDTMFADILNMTDTMLANWLPPLNATWTDPLLAEASFVPDDPDMDLLDFQQNTSDTNSVNIFGNETLFSVGDLFVQVLDRANKYLGAVTTDEESGQQELGINNFLQKYLLDENGAFDFTFDNAATAVDGEASNAWLDIHDALTKTQIRLNGLRLTGLDTLTSFNPFIAVGKHTLSNELGWDRISLQVDLTINVEPSSREDAIFTSPNPVSITEDITLSIDFVNIDMLLSIFVPINESKIGEMTLGSLLDPVGLLPCFLSAVEALEISGIDVTLDDMTPPVLDGFISVGTDRVLSDLAEAIFAAYEPTMLRAIPGIFQGPIRSALNELLSSSESSCENLKENAEQGSFVDFRDLILPKSEALSRGGSGEAPYGIFVSSIFDLLKDEFFVENPSTPGLAAVNEKLIADLGESQSGTPGRFFFPGSVFNVDQKVAVAGLRAGIKLSLSDVFINNVDSFGIPLTLLDPVSGEAHLLSNDATVGLVRPLEVGFRFFFGLYGEGAEPIENDVTVTLSMDTLKILLEAFLLVSEESFMKFPVQDITNLQCWLATIPAPELDSRGVMKVGQLPSLDIKTFAATAAKTGLKIDCVDCSGPKIIELSTLLTDQFEGEPSADLTNVVNGAFDLLNELVSGTFLQVLGDRALNDARKQCPHSPDYDPNFEGADYAPFDIEAEEESVSFFAALIIILVVMLVAALIVVLTTKLVVRRRHRKWIAAMPRSQVRALYKQQHEEDAKQAEINESTTSMFRSSIIPLWVRLFMPVVILGNIGLFISGHLSLGASVTIMVSIGGQPFRTDDFYEFQMASGTIDIWNAGGKELAILIFLFSFVWPYTKQIITMVLWFAPTNRVFVQTRGSILLWLDALAKWSIIDVFTLVVTIVAFRVSIQSPTVDFLPEDLYSIDLLVIPKWGLYANMTAQLISQISSHYIIHYHRRIVRQATGEDAAVATIPTVAHTSTTLMDDDDNEIVGSEVDNSSGAGNMLKKNSHTVVAAATEDRQDRLCDHAFRRPHRGETDKLVARRLVSPILCLASALLSGLVVLGCVLPTYSVNAMGIIGVLVETGQAFYSAETDYSVVTTMKLFFDQAELTGTPKDYIGLGSLTILVIMTVLVVPVVQAGVLLVQWFAPLTKKRRYRWSIALEILQAWQYAEVFLLSLLVSSWQLGRLSEFMINPYCESLESIFAELVHYGILKDEDAQCFRADVNVEPAFYALLVGALLLTMVNTFIMQAVTHYFRDLDGKTIMAAQEKLSDLGALEAHEDDTADGEPMNERNIHPAPVLFTDHFRWFLYREDAMIPSAIAPWPSQSLQGASAMPRNQSALDDVAKSSAYVFESESDDEAREPTGIYNDCARRSEFLGSDDESGNGQAPNGMSFESDCSDVKTLSEVSLSGFDASGARNPFSC